MHPHTPTYVARPDNRSFSQERPERHDDAGHLRSPPLQSLSMAYFRKLRENNFRAVEYSVPQGQDALIPPCGSIGGGGKGGVNTRTAGTPLTPPLTHNLAKTTASTPPPAAGGGAASTPPPAAGVGAASMPPPAAGVGVASTPLPAASGGAHAGGGTSSASSAHAGIGMTSALPAQGVSGTTFIPLTPAGTGTTSMPTNGNGYATMPLNQFPNGVGFNGVPLAYGFPNPSDLANPRSSSSEHQGSHGPQSSSSGHQGSHGPQSSSSGHQGRSRRASRHPDSSSSHPRTQHHNMHDEDGSEESQTSYDDSDRNNFGEFGNMLKSFMTAQSSMSSLPKVKLDKYTSEGKHEDLFSFLIEYEAMMGNAADSHKIRQLHMWISSPAE
jgi:hypothetical protein